MVTNQNEVVLKLERRMRTAEQVTLLRLAAQIIHIHGKQRNRIRDLESFYPKINKRDQRELCSERKFVQMRPGKLCAISNSVAEPKPINRMLHGNQAPVGTRSVWLCLKCAGIV
jgi:hypothetical protein